MMAERGRWLLLAVGVFGLINAVLYCSVTPLWEGFDEPFHYGYVQVLTAKRTLPVVGDTTLSQEIWQSLKHSPGSHIIKQNIPWMITFTEYGSLAVSERNRLRQKLERIDSVLRTRYEGTPLNYEAHQAPLAYAALAIPDSFWASVPLPARIWRLRLVCAVLSCIGVWAGTWLLTRRLRLSPSFQTGVLFVVLSTQMLYASTAHVCNDWLAVPLVAFTLVTGVRAIQAPSWRTLVLYSITMSLGLLTKAYFLALLPGGVLLVIWLLLKRQIRWREVLVFVLPVLLIGGPWYARNVTLYGSLSGMQESVGSPALGDFAQALLSIPWISSLSALASRSIWMGNNSDLTFSFATIRLMLACLVLSGALYATAAVRKRPPTAEVFLVVNLLVYGMALVYLTLLSYLFTKGKALFASPWYSVPLLAPLASLLLAGLSRSGRFGRALACCLVGLWAYVISITHPGKLIPLYAGWGGAPRRPAALIGWYVRDWDRIADMLATTTLAAPGFLLGLSVAVCVVAPGLGFLLCRGLLLEERSRPR